MEVLIVDGDVEDGEVKVAKLIVVFVNGLLEVGVIGPNEIIVLFDLSHQIDIVHVMVDRQHYLSVLDHCIFIGHHFLQDGPLLQQLHLEL